MSAVKGRLADIPKNQLAGVVTAVVLAGFAAFIVYLLVDISAGETAWSRRTYLFAAVEAIAFAAVGWLFGKEVHRERAETAEKKASSSVATLCMSTRHPSASSDVLPPNPRRSIRTTWY
jgi:Kef-type K+ transport system membrane component KefB